MLVIQSRGFGFVATKDLFGFLILRPDEFYSRNSSCALNLISILLAHLAVVRRKLFQRSSPLKLLDQLEPKLVWIITRMSSFKIVPEDAVHQSTWSLLLKIEHRKIAVFG
jgi:hypothetical protein